LPEESLEWDETQWEDYFRTDNGRELLDLMLPFIAESIEADEDAAVLQAFLEQVFANDPELRAYYHEVFFGIPPENGSGSEEPVTEEEPIPSESESPSASIDIKPAGDINKTPSAEKQTVAKSADASVPALANTGFDGFTAAVAGLLVALAGAVFIALGRRKSAKH